MRILIIEDEEAIALPVKRTLERRGYAVDYAEDGKVGLTHIHANHYDCILLDLNLPEIDGIELAKKIRQEANTTPIIMVTARSQLFNKLEGFEAGTDDYVTKPFDLAELVMRIEAIIRRNSVNKESNLIFGNFELFPKQNKVVEWTDNVDNKKVTLKEVELSNKETAILEYLLRHKGQIVSSEELLEHVWDKEVDLFTQTLKTHIKTLRKKIDPEKKVIQTFRGKGYRIDQN